MGSPKKTPARSPKKKSSRTPELEDNSYSATHGAGGFARVFKELLSKTVSRYLSTTKVSLAEIRSYLVEQFDDSSYIEKSSFLEVIKSWKDTTRSGLRTSDFKSIFHSIDKEGSGTITVSNIIKYISLGEKIKKHDDDDTDSSDEEDNTSVWGSSPIVDVQISTTDLDSSKLSSDGYTKVNVTNTNTPANLNEGSMLSQPILLWYRRRSASGHSVRLKSIVDITLSPRNVDSSLVIAGYTCLNSNTNSNKSFGLSKPQYIWLRRAATQEEQDKDGIVDIKITIGNKNNLDDVIHKPPGKGFILVPGDLNNGMVGKNVFLWFQPLTPRSSGKSYWLHGVTPDERNYELEQKARRAIRQFVSPSDVNFSPRGGPTDFAVLFNRHALVKGYDKSKIGTLNITLFTKLLKEVGLNCSPADTAHLLHRIDVSGTDRLNREDFLKFVEYNDDELDTVCYKIKDLFGGKDTSNKKVLKAIQQRFKRLDVDGDGILDIDEFKQMVSETQIYLTESELMRLRKTFDRDGDGMIGKDEFESVVTMNDDACKKQCVRVCDAVQGVRDYVLQCQREVRKKGSKDGVDSESAWLDLERKHTRGKGGTPFPGYLDVEDIAMCAERLGYRLSQPESRMLIMRISPDGIGSVTEDEFHDFSKEPKPRPIGELISLMGKNRDAVCRELMDPNKTDKKLQKYINRVVTSIGPDDIGLVTISALATGLQSFFNYRERAGQPTDGELVAIAQYLGAVDPRFFQVDPRLFVVGLRCECTGEDPALLLEGFEEEEEDGQAYSDLLKDRKKTRSRAHTDDDDDEDFFGDKDGEWEYIDEEVEEEIPVEDELFDVCNELAGFFQEIAEQDSGKMDYEKVLDDINEEALTESYPEVEERQPGSLMDIEKEFAVWLSKLDLTESMTDEQFGELLERVDPKNTSMIGAKQLEAFAKGETWDNKPKMKIVKKTIKKKVKKAKSSKKATHKGSSKKGKKGKRGSYLSDSDPDSDDSGSNAGSDSDAGSFNSDSSDDDGGSFWGSSSSSKKKKKGGKSRSPSKRRTNRRPDSDADSDDAAEDSDDFISSPSKSSSAKKSITGNSRADSLAREIARALSSKHRNIGSGLEQMLKTEFRRMDIYGHGMLRAEEISLALRGLGYYKQTLTPSTPGIDHFMDRGGSVDFNGFAAAIGQAAWEVTHGGRAGSVTSSKKLDKKLRTLARDLNEGKNGSKIFSEKADDDGSLSANGVKSGLKKFGKGTDIRLNDGEIRELFKCINDEVNGDGGERSVSITDWRHYISSDGEMPFAESASGGGDSTERSFYSDGDAMDSDKTSAIERCIEAFDEMDLNSKAKGKIRPYFEKLDKGGKGTVSVKNWETFVKKSALKSKLSSRERKTLTQTFDSGKNMFDYESFLDKVIENPSGFSSSRSGSGNADAALNRIQEAVSTNARTGVTYGMMFSRFDASGAGLVTRDGLISALRSVGCYLTEDDVSVLIKQNKIPKRKDNMINYNDLYQVLLQTTPRVTAPMGGGATPYNSLNMSINGRFGGMNVTGYGGAATPWNPSGTGGAYPNSPYSSMSMSMPPPGAMSASMPWQTPFNPSLSLGGSAALGGVGMSGDHLLQDVALKLRNAMRQRVSQWGPTVSLHRQFEASDPDRRGYVNLKSFLMVLEQLSVVLTPVEVGMICRKFDRNGNDTVDYLDFCRFVSIDAREMEIVASKLASKFAELRRRGVSATATFDVYDIGRTGFITRRDFRESSRQLQLPVTENQLEALMGRFAHQGDSELVSWQEFVTFVNASGVNLPLDEMENPVMGDGYDGMDVWYDKVGSHGGREPGSRGGSPGRRGGNSGGGTPTRRSGGEGEFNSMYKSLRSHDREGGDDIMLRSIEDNYGAGVMVDHTNRNSRSHTQDMEMSRQVGRDAVNYLDNHGVSTPKWIRSVLKVGRGKEGFDAGAESGDSDAEVDFGNKRVSRGLTPTRSSSSKRGGSRSNSKNRRSGGRSRRYADSDSSDGESW
jgi:Ca2+-binding EF-hand superfamily protein